MTFNSISNLWSGWNIQGFIILSLLLQFFLILFAPFRKRTANDRIVFLLWLAYLMADSVAAFGIGLISHNQGNLSAHAAEVDGALHAFWASFLLLHLGGPDTITAFALEDSLLWLRHMLSLIFQVAAIVYITVLIFLSDKLLVIPTMLVFLAAVWKNVERTLALNFSSLKRLKESMLSYDMYSDGEDYESAIVQGEVEYEEEDEVDEKVVEDLDALEYRYFDKEEARLPETSVVKHAHTFFQIFKVLIGDILFTGKQRNTSREYFYKLSAVDALRVISVELHFIYEVLHTKALVIRSKWSYIFRFIAFTNIVIALVLFSRLKKHRYLEHDVEITYVLLFGGIALDVIALFMLIFSDWTIARNEQDSFLHKLVSTMYNLRKPRFVTYKLEPNANVTYTVLDTPFIFRRWSESISACNIFSMSLKKSPRRMYKCDHHQGFIIFSIICKKNFRMAEKIISFFHQASKTIAKGCGLRTRTLMIENTKYVSKNHFITKLWVFIFEEVKRKSKDAVDLSKVHEIFEARGDLSLKSNNGGIDPDDLSAVFIDEIFSTNIIKLHIGTEVLYNIEKPSETANDEKEFSKILSDYMLYLLLNQNNVVSAVAGDAQVTVARILRRLEKLRDHEIKDLKGLCEKAVENSSFNIEDIVEDWEDVVIEMRKLKDEKWKVMSGVWVEMLSYAAVHIKGEAHVKVLSKGGELLAFVWLLMAHFGCFYKPEYGISLANQ